MNTSKAGILAQLQTTMGEMFELSEQEITYEARLYEDLDLDSIDAVDLIVQLQSITGRKFNPDEFKQVRTIEDVVNVIHAALNTR